MCAIKDLLYIILLQCLEDLFLDKNLPDIYLIDNLIMANETNRQGINGVVGNMKKISISQGFKQN